MTPATPLEPIAAALKSLAAPDRLAIVLAIGEGEACVCHLEAVLGLRQAAISQHLMALRRAGLLLDRRDGRFVYYRLASRAVLDLVGDAGRLVKATLTPWPTMPPAGCACPLCAGQMRPQSEVTGVGEINHEHRLLPA